MKRVLRVDNILHEIGTIINQANSEIIHKDNRLREIFVDSCDWDSMTWISQDGIAYQRYYNIWNETWRFSDEKVPGISDTGELLLSVGSGKGARRIRLCRAIAIAWLDFPKKNKQENRIAMTLREDEELDIDNIGWVRRTFKTSNGEYPENISIPSSHPQGKQQWYPIILYRYWRNGEYEKFECPEKISDTGWIRLVDGSHTKGYNSHNGRLRVCLQTYGSVWLEDLYYGSLKGSIPCDKKILECRYNYDVLNIALVDKETILNSRSHQMYIHFCSGNSIKQICEIFKVSKSTVWSRIYDIVQYLPNNLIPTSFWENIIYDPILVKYKEQWIHSQHPILGYPLKDMKSMIEDHVDLDDDDLFGMLKIIKELSHRLKFSTNE